MMKSIIHWEKDLFFRAVNGSGFEVTMAAPNSNGTNIASRPTELLLAGVGGCTAMDIVSTLKEMNISLDQLSVEVRGKRQEEYPMIFTNLYLHYIIIGDVPAVTLEEIIQNSMKLYCSASLSLKAEKSFTYEINGIQYK